MKISAKSFVVIVTLSNNPHPIEEEKLEKDIQKAISDMETKLFETEPIGVYSFKETIFHAVESTEERNVYMLGKALVMIEKLSPSIYADENYLGVGFVIVSSEVDMQIKNIRSALSLILNTHELGYDDVKRYQKEQEIELHQGWEEFVGSGPDLHAFLRENGYTKVEQKEVNLFPV